MRTRKERFRVLQIDPSQAFIRVPAEEKSRRCDNGRNIRGLTLCYFKSSIQPSSLRRIRHLAIFDISDGTVLRRILVYSTRQAVRQVKCDEVEVRPQNTKTCTEVSKTIY